MHRPWLAWLCVCIPLASAGGQVQLTGDAGAARIEQTGFAPSYATTGGATLDLLNDRAWLRTSALVAVVGTDRVTAQGLLLGSLLGAPSQRLGARWELSGAISGFGQTSDVPTTSGEAMGRVRFDRLGDGRGGAAIGAGAGAIRHQGKNRALVHGQGDAWWRPDADQIVASVSAVHVSSTTQLFSPFPGLFVEQEVAAVSYADIAVSWRRDLEMFSLSALGGMRVGPKDSEGGKPWGSAEAAVWFTPHSAVVVSGGRSLADALRGVPRTTFGSIALRLSAQPRAVRARRDTVSGARLVVASVGTSRRLEVRGVDAGRLELIADFTDWQPVELVRGVDVWRLERAIPSGLHRVALRIDGGPWIAPANLPRVSDELGGVVGLITVP